VTGQQEPDQQIQSAFQVIEQGRAQISRIIAGQQPLIDQALMTLLCGGHALIEGVPGVAKTLAVK
jgi:MoxR-like ATPase